LQARTASGASHLVDLGLSLLFLLNCCSERLLFICLLFEATFVVFCLRCHVRELLFKTVDLISLSHMLAIINNLLGRRSIRKSGLHHFGALRHRFVKCSFWKSLRFLFGHGSRLNHSRHACCCLNRKSGLHHLGAYRLRFGRLLNRLHSFLSFSNLWPTSQANVILTATVLDLTVPEATTHCDTFSAKRALYSTIPSVSRPVVLWRIEKFD